MIIDTNTYTALKQDNPAVLSLVKGAEYIRLPLPVVAELQYGFVNGARTTLNRTMLADFLAQEFVQVLLPVLSTCDLYAELRLYARRRGRSLSNNDIWIAALAREDGDVLVTYDRDFMVFQELFGDKLKVLS